MSSTYTPTGQLASTQNGAGDTTLQAYDVLDRLSQATDPVGRIARNEYDAAGQVNLYAYVGNDPINGIDPNGLCTSQANASSDTPASAICQDAVDLRISDQGREATRSEEGGNRTTVYADTGGVQQSESGIWSLHKTAQSL